jgi:hypothetical protein
VLVGSTSLIASAALKILPESISSKIPALFNENQKDDKSKIVQLYKKSAEAKVSNMKKPKFGKKAA